MSISPHLVLEGSRSFAAAATLWRRELTHFFRERRRLVASLLTPLIFWWLLGSGLDRAVAFEAGYRAYFFPGAVIMSVMFTTILAAYSVIEDRRAGFLQSVIVAPVSRGAIAAGKILGGATVATVQGGLILLLWPWVGADAAADAGFGATAVSLLAALLSVMAVATLLTAVGFILAWPMRSTSGFHAVLNLVVFPLWFLSGALFPLESAPLWLQAVMWANPLTYGQAALQSALHGPGGGPAASAPLHWPLAAGVAIALAVLAVALAGWRARGGEGRD